MSKVNVNNDINRYQREMLSMLSDCKGYWALLFYSVPQWNKSVKVGGLETGTFTGLCYGLESASFLRY